MVPNDVKPQNIQQEVFIRGVVLLNAGCLKAVDVNSDSEPKQFAVNNGSFNFKKRT